MSQLFQPLVTILKYHLPLKTLMKFVFDILANYWNRTFKGAMKMLKVWPGPPCFCEENQENV